MDLKDLDLKALFERCHTLALEKGWWEKREPKPCVKCGYYHRELPEILMLMGSEIFEAFEEYRDDGKPAFYMKDGKPEGIAIEIIDVVVRIMDWFGHEDLDFEKLLKLKMQFNEDRPFRHGGKKA